MKNYIIILCTNLLFLPINGSTSKLPKQIDITADVSISAKPNLDKDGYVILNKPTQEEIINHAKITQEVPTRRKSSISQAKSTIKATMDSVLGQPKEKAPTKPHKPPVPEESNIKILIRTDPQIHTAETAIYRTETEIKKKKQN